MTRRKRDDELVRHRYWRRGDDAKWCSSCAETLPVGAFYIRGATGTPLSRCIRCSRAASDRYIAEHPDRHRQYAAVAAWRRRQSDRLVGADDAQHARRADDANRRCVIGGFEDLVRDGTAFDVDDQSRTVAETDPSEQRVVGGEREPARDCGGGFDDW